MSWDDATYGVAKEFLGTEMDNKLLQAIDACPMGKHVEYYFTQEDEQQMLTFYFVDNKEV